MSCSQRFRRDPGLAQMSAFARQGIPVPRYPIRPFVPSVKHRNALTGYKSVSRNTEVREAIVALWDDPNGLFLYPYAQDLLDSTETAWTVVRETTAKLCSCPDTLFLGDVLLRERERTINFHRDTQSGRDLQLKGLLIGAFGYTGLDPLALKLFEKNLRFISGDSFLDSSAISLSQPNLLSVHDLREG